MCVVALKFFFFNVDVKKNPLKIRPHIHPFVNESLDVQTTPSSGTNYNSMLKTCFKWVYIMSTIFSFCRGIVPDTPPPHCENSVRTYGSRSMSNDSSFALLCRNSRMIFFFVSNVACTRMPSHNDNNAPRTKTTRNSKYNITSNIGERNRWRRIVS